MDFLRSMDAPWVAELDLGTLEKLPTEHVRDRLRKLHNDLVWRVRHKVNGTWQHLHIVFEAQSNVDRDMALRILGYNYAGYRGMSRGNQRGESGLLTPIVSIVLYTGDQEWTASRQMAELIEPVSETMDDLVVKLAYELAEQRKKPKQRSVDPDNIAQAAMAEGRSTEPKELIEAFRRTWKVVEKRPAIKRAYVLWSRYNSHRRLRGRQVKLPATVDQWPEVVEEHLMEFGAEFKKRTRAKIRAEVRTEIADEVRTEVADEVRTSVEDQVIGRLRQDVALEIRGRFGDSLAEEAGVVLERISQTEQMLAVYRWALTCPSGDALLERFATA